MLDIFVKLLRKYSTVANVQFLVILVFVEGSRDPAFEMQ